MESLLAKGAYLQEILDSGTDSDGPPSHSDDTAAGLNMADLQAFKAQRRTRTGGPFLTIGCVWG
jgi:hypothetical protein